MLGKYREATADLKAVLDAVKSDKSVCFVFSRSRHFYIHFFGRPGRLPSKVCSVWWSVLRTRRWIRTSSKWTLPSPCRALTWFCPRFFKIFFLEFFRVVKLTRFGAQVREFLALLLLPSEEQFVADLNFAIVVEPENGALFYRRALARIQAHDFEHVFADAQVCRAMPCNASLEEAR
jgi:hypothetical protein